MAAGVADAVAAGMIDEASSVELVLIVAVWVDPDARDDDLVFANNREATAGALALGRAGLPAAADVVDPARRRRGTRTSGRPDERSSTTRGPGRSSPSNGCRRPTPTPSPGGDWAAVRALFEPDAAVHIDTRTREPFTLEGPDALVDVHRAGHRAASRSSSSPS